MHFRWVCIHSPSDWAFEKLSIGHFSLQESTANVDEWKRQLHSYKEENQRLKLRIQDLENAKGGLPSDALTEDLKKEIASLKSRIEGLEKELMSQEAELKAAKVNLKDKNNDPMMKNLVQMYQQFSIHMGNLQNVQKEMDKLIQLNKTTWDLQNLQTKLNLIENQQCIFSEEIFNSLKPRDSNNNRRTNDNLSMDAKANSKEENNNSTEQQRVETHGTLTLKRKRDSKSPSLKISPTESVHSSKNNAGKKQSQTTATILVSKTKTKSTGLPTTILKKWIFSERERVWSPKNGYCAKVKEKKNELLRHPYRRV